MKSIRWRLVSFYVVLVILVMIVSGTLIVTMLRNDSYSNLENELKETVRNIKVDIDLYATDEAIEESLTQNIEGLSSIARDKKIFLLDSEGYELYPYEDSDRSNPYNNHVVTASTNGIFVQEVGRVYTEERGQIIEYREYAEPVIVGGDEVAFIIYAKMSTALVEENLNDTIFIIVISILIALLLATVLGTVLSNSLTKPVSVLTSKAREMANGKLDNEIEVKSDDEIGELTQNFNIMARELNKTLSEMMGEKNKLETVFSHMTDGILVFDKKGMLTHINPASKVLFEGEISNNFNEIFVAFMDAEYNEMLTKVQKNTFEHVIQVKDKYLNICFAPYQLEKPDNIGIICVVQDVTQHKKLEEMQKEFVANVSHELRTPLTTIKSYTETLLEGMVDDEETTTNFLEVINNESDRMTNLVKDLLELSKLDNRQTQFKMQLMNLSYVLEESVSKYQIHAHKKNQDMILHPADKKYKVMGDPNRIEQVIKNIISNAVKYTKENGHIHINIYDEKDEVIISIKDTGVGIPQEDLNRIFERFYRVDKARSREMGGTGLGLAIAKEIMEYHNGKIRVESDAKEGTCFYLHFKNADVKE
ncbi:two-component system sensor histidine kinase VicK [Natranaerovirga hydrolytica]|uniref:histidine kinase n=1 Tax=Natranaerovirga hydrolytica TaxID=680378 RepID=A0A4R1MM52_9FIRM|nr:ATP-binding protein [Natranaerovirga hydrolytica]TCK93170.1 two-component system sensor histidine kinase VicK [Natranaerovirga hydrolytica]